MWLTQEEGKVRLAVQSVGNLAAIVAVPEGQWSQAHTELVAETRSAFGKHLFGKHLGNVLTERMVTTANDHANRFFASTAHVSVEAFKAAKLEALQAIATLPGIDEADSKRKVLSRSN